MPVSILKLAVFCSGGGSNFQSILNASESGDLACKTVLCLCNKAGIGALKRAENYGIPSVLLDPAAFSTEDDYTEALQSTLDSHGVDFIALAGYLKKIPLQIVQRYRGRMLNIHPALLPSFGGKGLYGRNVHRAAIEYGVRWSGVTIHLVDEAYDTGPVILQEPVPVLEDDTPESLAARVLAVEHRLYPEALQLFAEGRVSVSGRKVIIRNKLEE